MIIYNEDGTAISKGTYEQRKGEYHKLLNAGYIQSGSSTYMGSSYEEEFFYKRDIKERK